MYFLFSGCPKPTAPDRAQIDNAKDFYAHNEKVDFSCADNTDLATGSAQSTCVNGVLKVDYKCFKSEYLC